MLKSGQSRSLEDRLQTRMVISIESPCRGFLLLFDNASSDVDIIRAGMYDDGESAIRPELSFSSKPLRSANNCEQRGSPHWADARQFQQQRVIGGLFTLDQEFCFRFFAQVLKSVEFLEQGFGAKSSSFFRQLGQPVRALILAERA